MSSMWWDLSLQALVFLVSIAAYLWTNNIPQKLFTQYHAHRNRHKHQARRHFVKAAEHLSDSHLSSAVKEADAAILLDPTDAACHILKAVALELQGFNTSALDALNVALSPLAVKSLEKEEKADAVAKRAQLRMAVAPTDLEVWRVAERELKEVVELKKESVKAWCLLGKCCEGLKKNEAAIEAFEEAVKIAPNSAPAKEGLQRVRSLLSEEKVDNDDQ